MVIMWKNIVYICGILVLFNFSLCASGSFLDISNISVEKYSLDLSNRNLSKIDRNILSQANSTVHKLILDGNQEFDLPYEDAVLVDKHFQTFHCIGCNISRIFRESFAKLPHLREIVIQENPLWGIHPDAFKDNPLLRRLDLRRNNLKSFNRMGVLNHMRNLMMIHLSHNDFNLNVKYPIMHMTYMVRLECEGCNIEHISPEAFSGIGTLYHLNLRNNKIQQFNLTISGLRSLDLSHNPVNLTGYELNQPDLETFNCDHCSTSAIDNGIFAKCIDLLSVEMRHNGMEAISDHAFRNNLFLKHIELDGNKLKRIPSKLIRKDSMEHLCFDFNPIKGTPDEWKLMRMYFVRELGENCAVRKNSSLVGHLMHIVHPEGVLLIRFHNFREKIADLRGKNVTFIFPDYFQAPHDNFTYLLMDGNSQFNFQPRVPFTFYQNLEEFQCNGCGIDAIYGVTFSYTPNIQRLELKNNKITHIALADFHPNVALQTLTFDGNPIELLYGKATRHFRDLDVLLPAKLPEKSIKVLPALETLTCINCNISILHVDTFRYTPNLKMLNMEGHNLNALNQNLSVPIEDLNLLGKLQEFPMFLLNSTRHLKYLCINYELINATEIAKRGEKQSETLIKTLENLTCLQNSEVDQNKKILINKIRRKLGEFRETEEKRRLAEKQRKRQSFTTTLATTTTEKTTTTLETTLKTTETELDDVEILTTESNKNSSNWLTKDGMKRNEKLVALTKIEQNDTSVEVQISSVFKFGNKTTPLYGNGNGVSCTKLLIVLCFSIIFTAI